MTTVTTAQSSEVTYPLSPFQRAALAYAARPLAVTVEVDVSPEILVQRAEHALNASPELTATLHPVPGLRIPRQAPTGCRRESSLDRWRLVAGDTSLTAERHGARTTLTIAVDGLVADSRSIELFCERIASGSIANDPVGFFDAAAGHAAMVQEGELDQEKEYWQALAAGNDGRPALGVGPGPADQRVAAILPIESALLVEFAAEQRVDVAEVLYLSLHLLLDRVSERAALGRLVDARELMGLENTSGLLTQVVLDPVNLDPEAPAVALLAAQVGRVRKHTEMAGGPALTEESSPPSVVFDPRTTWTLPSGWRLVDAFEGRCGALLLRGLRDGNDLQLRATACDGTDAAALRTLLAAWADVIAAVVREPHTPWGSLDITDEHPGARDELRAALDHVPAEDVCARVFELAKTDPEAAAIRHGEWMLSRRALLTRIGDVTAALGPLEPGAVVAVLAGPEPDVVAAWLAVLWQGAAFLPLSPAEPRQRIEHAIADAAAATVLVGSEAPEFAAPTGCKVIRMRDVELELCDAAPPAPPDADQLGYVLRTSGSTGRPKLVAVGRGSLNNYLRWVADDLLVEDGGDLPVLSSPIFDASFKQLLGPLYAGRATWLLEADRTDPARVYAELAAIETPFSLNCVPSYWAELLDAGGDGRLALRKLLLGGEPVSEALLRRTAREYPETDIRNLYGPTEATATATAGGLVPGEPVHVGTGVAGAFVAVADPYRRALPRGMRGEVWIAGPGRAQGYVGDVDQTGFDALRIGGRTVPAYRTGDAGRIDGEGRLRLEGRLDSQLKVRGWRIEPEEIERVAETAPDVVSAVVVLDERAEPHQLRLFFLGDASDASVLDVLRDWLPAPMVPASVTHVARFPRTSTGKLDRATLLEAVSTRPEASPEDYDPLQLEIATVWREVVGRGWPHSDEDFFTAGGHSLLLARLVNQLRTRGHESISLRQVVRNPTVNTIAGLIRAAEGG